jgi:hypothetical protein
MMEEPIVIPMNVARHRAMLKVHVDDHAIGRSSDRLLKSLASKPKGGATDRPTRERVCRGDRLSSGNIVRR